MAGRLSDRCGQFAQRLPALMALLLSSGCMTVEVPQRQGPTSSSSTAASPATLPARDPVVTTPPPAIVQQAVAVPAPPPTAAVTEPDRVRAATGKAPHQPDAMRQPSSPQPAADESPTQDAELLPLRSGAQPSDSAAQPLAPDFAAQATEVALGMLGRPYRMGGITPEGFDCSGLVYFSYGQLGVAVPRDTQRLRDITTAIPDAQRRIGDLVFFHIRGRQFSHVGLYVGEGRFLHAPASGGEVRIEKLSVGYWTQRYAGTRRLSFAPVNLGRR